MSSLNHFSLLVIDDEPDLRTLYELTLLREGYDLETAGSVDEALLRLQDRSYSAIITDMRLPDGSGLDLLRWLETNGRREKAIVITAYGSAENAVEALKAGAYDYLTKPVDLKQFRAVIASALGRGGVAQPSMNPATLPSEHGAASGASGKQAASSVAAAAPTAPAAAESEIAAVMPAIISGAPAPPRPAVNRHAPRNGAGSRGSARSEPSVMMMPLPGPLASARKIAMMTNHVVFAERSCVKARTMCPTPRPSTDGTAVQSLPKRSMMAPPV